MSNQFTQIYFKDIDKYASLKKENLPSLYMVSDNTKFNSLKNLNKKVYDEFNDAIKERDSKGYTSDTTFIGINSSNIKDHEQKNNFLEVTVDFVSEIISSIKDKEKKVITDNDEVTKSRLVLIKVVSMTLNKGLSLLKITSPKSM